MFLWFNQILWNSLYFHSQNYMRDVKVTGSRGNVDRALVEIKKKTADFVKRENDSGEFWQDKFCSSFPILQVYISFSAGFSNFNSAGGDHRETIEVETAKVGRIVGKAGATINQLQDDHKVRIDIKKEDNMVSWNKNTTKKSFMPAQTFLRVISERQSWCWSLGCWGRCRQGCECHQSKTQRQWRLRTSRWWWVKTFWSLIKIFFTRALILLLWCV